MNNNHRIIERMRILLMSLNMAGPIQGIPTWLRVMSLCFSLFICFSSLALIWAIGCVAGMPSGLLLIFALLVFLGNTIILLCLLIYRGYLLMFGSDSRC